MKSTETFSLIYLINDKNIIRNDTEIIIFNSTKSFFLSYLSIILPMKFDNANPVTVPIKIINPYRISPLCDMSIYHVIPIYIILTEILASSIDKTIYKKFLGITAPGCGNRAL